MNPAIGLQQPQPVKLCGAYDATRADSDARHPREKNAMRGRMVPEATHICLK